MPDRYDFDRTLPDDMDAVVARALAEDIGDGDVNAALIDAERTAFARVQAREPLTLAGGAWFNAVYKSVHPDVTIEWHAADGERVATDAYVCDLRGPARALLTGERTALNFLQLLSGVASATADYVERVAGTTAKIVDTRKTLPGLRAAQKYAVRAGGGCNQRFGLFDAFLIKENHILSAGSIPTAVAAARDNAAALFLQVEAETLEELDQCLAAGVDSVLLDNFGPDLLGQAMQRVAVFRADGGEVMVEASGDISLDNVHEIAAAGVDRISIGGLTKHLRAADFSMRMEIEPD